ncbi:UNVERIFIED_CONTAM: Glycine-rich protein 2 [Sesamum radiatum]|uniref:Glycine-rich protein 2 n=1 Tax=Sesamum radiatum TaxID=300843 RepID=A0AAW2P6P4_SESRA
MAEEKVTRSKGVVTKFNDQKGYGFIQPDEGGEDLFVHQTAIKSDGYRTLREGQVVEFTIILDGDKTKAADVTAPGGGPVDSTSRRGNNSNSRGVVMGLVIGGMMAMGMVIGVAAAAAAEEEVSVLIAESMVIWRDCNNGGGGGAGGGNGGGCYNCGGYGHMARECPSGSRGGGGGGACFTCGSQGTCERLYAWWWWRRRRRWLQSWEWWFWKIWRVVVGESVSTVGSLDTLPGNAKKHLVNNLMHRLS